MLNATLLGGDKWGRRSRKWNGGKRSDICSAVYPIHLFFSYLTAPQLRVRSHKWSQDPRTSTHRPCESPSQVPYSTAQKPPLAAAFAWGETNRPLILLPLHLPPWSPPSDLSVPQLWPKQIPISGVCSGRDLRKRTLFSGISSCSPMSQQAFVEMLPFQWGLPSLQDKAPSTPQSTPHFSLLPSMALFPFPMLVTYSATVFTVTAEVLWRNRLKKSFWYVQFGYRYCWYWMFKLRKLNIFLRVVAHGIILLHGISTIKNNCPITILQ